MLANDKIGIFERRATSEGDVVALARAPAGRLLAGCHVLNDEIDEGTRSTKSAKAASPA